MKDELIDDAGWYIVYYNVPKGQTTTCQNIVDGPFKTRGQAQSQIDEVDRTESLERHHQAQYDYACGYDD